jgi:hypothetical protein
MITLPINLKLLTKSKILPTNPPIIHISHNQPPNFNPPTISSLLLQNPSKTKTKAKTKT